MNGDRRRANVEARAQKSLSDQTESQGIKHSQLPQSSRVIPARWSPLLVATRLEGDDQQEEQSQNGVTQIADDVIEVVVNVHRSGTPGGESTDAGCRVT